MSWVLGFIGGWLVLVVASAVIGETYEAKQRARPQIELACEAFRAWQNAHWAYTESIYADMGTVLGGPHPVIRVARQEQRNRVARLGDEGMEMFRQMIREYFAPTNTEGEG